MNTFRRFVLLSFLLLAMVLLAGCGDTDSQPVENAASAPPSSAASPTPFRAISQVKIDSLALADNLLGDPATREFLIYLPPSYPTSDRRYPVIYALHGFTGNQWSMGTLQMKLQEMIQAGKAPEMILVVPDGSNALGGGMYMNSPTAGNYEDYIVQDLVGFVDANYRTIADPAARGLTGCSMGADGSVYLALRHPDVFSVAAGMSGSYMSETAPIIEGALAALSQIPTTFDEFNAMNLDQQWLIAEAAVVSPNPDKPPFFLDMPFEIIDGKAQMVPGMLDKINASYSASQVDAYLAQPQRLTGIMIYTGDADVYAPVELVRSFAQFLTDKGIPNEYVEVQYGKHCALDETPVIQFMADHLRTD